MLSYLKSIFCFQIKFRYGKRYAKMVFEDEVLSGGGGALLYEGDNGTIGVDVAGSVSKCEG